MFDQWQQPLDIRALVRQGVTLKGEVQLAELERLKGIALKDAPIRFDLKFGKDAEGQPVVQGSVQGIVDMTCQRCLKPVGIDIDASVALGVVTSEAEAKNLPDDLEPLILGDEPVRLSDLIEDEILLALPVVPRHAHQCVPAHREHEGPEKTDNPFAALRDMVNPSAH